MEKTKKELFKICDRLFENWQDRVDNGASIENSLELSKIIDDLLAIALRN